MRQDMPQSPDPSPEGGQPKQPEDGYGWGV